MIALSGSVITVVMSLMQLYSQWRTCGNCNASDSRELAAGTAAFEERRKWTEPCASCGDSDFSTAGISIPDLTDEILSAWSVDSNLSIFQQDEDVMFASAESFELLKQFVVRDDILPTKRGTLLSALCIIIFDNSADEDDPDTENDVVLAESARSFLSENLHLFDEIDPEYIYDYIRDSVFPKIGLQPKDAT